MDKEKLPLDSPIPLESWHNLSAFDCDVPALNDFLRKFAWQNQRNQSARTYVAAREETVVGYYTLAAASVRRDKAPVRIAKGLAAHPVPVILLARLAVDRTEKGKGLGAGLLRDALSRCLQAGAIVGCRAVTVHATKTTRPKRSTSVSALSHPPAIHFGYSF